MGEAEHDKRAEQAEHDERAEQAERPERTQMRALVHAAAGPDPSRTFWVGLAVGVVLVVVIVVLIVQNGSPVRFRLFALDVRSPLWLLLLAFLVAGLCLTALGRALWRHRRPRVQRRRSARRRLREIVDQGHGEDVDQGHGEDVDQGHGEDGEGQGHRPVR